MASGIARGRVRTTTTTTTTTTAAESRKMSAILQLIGLQSPSLVLESLLRSIDSCQIKVFAD